MNEVVKQGRLPTIQDDNTSGHLIPTVYFNHGSTSISSECR